MTYQIGFFGSFALAFSVCFYLWRQLQKLLSSQVSLIWLYLLPVLHTFFIYEIEINKGVVSYCSFKNPGNWYISKKHIIEEKYSVLLKTMKKNYYVKESE